MIKVKERKEQSWRKLTIHDSESADNDTLKDVKIGSARPSSGKRRRSKEKEAVIKVKKRKNGPGEKRKLTIHDSESDDNETLKDVRIESARPSSAKRRRSKETEKETLEKAVRTEETTQEINDQIDDLYIRDPNKPGLYIKKYRLKKPRMRKGQSRDTRIYDNTHACYFCGKVVLHINEHLKTHRTKVRLGCFTPYQRLWLYNGAPLVAFYDTLGIRRTYSRLKPPASSRGSQNEGRS